jgi:type I restriction enzyme S subunit
MTSSLVRLGDLGEFINGLAFKPEDWEDDGARIIRIQNLTDPTKPYNRTTRRVAERYLVHPGDLLVSWSASLGVFEWPGPDTGVLNQHIFRVIPKTNFVDKRYLRYALNEALIQMRRHLHGATMQHVNRGEFLNTKVLIPTLTEQRRIGAILDRADELRRNRRHTLCRLEDLIWATFDDMFGVLAVNPKYPIKRFGELIIEGPTNGLYKHSSAYGKGTPILRINNFYDGHITDLNDLRRVTLSQKEIEAFALKEGDIIINRVNSREFLGKSALIPALHEPVVFESNMMRIGIDNRVLDGQFCISLLQTSFIKRQIDRSAKDAVNQSSINQSDVCAFELLVPPIAKQRAFAARVTEVDRLKSICRSHLTRLDDLFGSLHHRAFSGALTSESEVTAAKALALAG